MLNKSVLASYESVMPRSRTSAHCGPEAGRRSLCYAVVLVLAALVSLSASGLEISYLAKPPFVGSNASEQIFLQGEIVPGDYGRFVEFIRQDPDRFLRQT